MSTPNEPQRGDVWLADLEPTRGDEIRKTRPVVVVSTQTVGRLSLRIVVPVTAWNVGFTAAPWMVRLDPTPENGLSKASAADAFQVRSLSIDRLHSHQGHLAPVDLDEITKAVALCIGYHP